MLWRRETTLTDTITKLTFFIYEYKTFFYFCAIFTAKYQKVSINVICKLQFFLFAEGFNRNAAYVPLKYCTGPHRSV